MAYVIALFQKQHFCLSNKPTTACGCTGKNVQSPARLCNRGGIIAEINLRFAPPTMCRRTSYLSIKLRYNLLLTIFPQPLFILYFGYFLLNYLFIILFHSFFFIILLKIFFFQPKFTTIININWNSNIFYNKTSHTSKNN